MLYREIIAVCFQIHTQHINTLCGQKVEMLNVKLALRIVNTGLWRVKNPSYFMFDPQTLIRPHIMQVTGPSATFSSARPAVTT